MTGSQGMPFSDARKGESPCLGCVRIEVATVTLRDGTIVCDTCEAWRHECEVRAVVDTMAGRRKTYIEGVAKERGEKAAKRLEQDVRDELARRKATTGEQG